MKSRGFLAALATLAVSLAACDRPAAGGRAPEAAVVPAVGLAHNWTVHDDDGYGYGSLIGKRALGAAAAPVTMFRYLGIVDGEYQLSIGDPSGTIASCANPCATIRYIQEGDTIQRVAYDPKSAIGAAFADAFNGRLEVYQLRPPEMEQATLSAPLADSGSPPPPADEPQPVAQGAPPAAPASLSDPGAPR